MTPARDRGFALLIVLWSLVLLGLLITQILASGRTALALAGNLRAAATARASADGAINEALFHVLSAGADHWPPDGSPHSLGNAGGTVISVRVKSLTSQINPNLASTGLLAGLLQASGATPAQAKQLANAIIQWRSPAVSKQEAAAQVATYRNAGLPYAPPGHLFADLSELGDVLGMPPPLLAKALPHMNLYQTDDPNPALSDPVVRQALKLSGQAGSDANVYDGTVPVVSIEADVTAPGHVAAHRVAVIGLASTGAPAPFHILSLTGG